MTTAYLKRTDILNPNLPDPRGIYAVKLFEDADLTTVQDAVNAYLFALPDSAEIAGWRPHIIDTQLEVYLSPPPMSTPVYVMKVTLFAIGDVTAVPA